MLTCRFVSLRRIRRLRLRSLTILVILTLGVLSISSFPPTAFEQDTRHKPGKDDPKYYDRLLDSVFYDVNRVVELGMDYALTYKDRLEHDFIEWAAGRDMKGPEAEEYYHAMEVLNQGWKLLLRAGTIYNQARERQTNDATTERLRTEAQQLRAQGVAKVREANALRRAADEKRAARKLAEQQKLDREKAAAKEQQINEVKGVATQFEQLNTAEEKEQDQHNAEIARISSGPASRRQALLKQEDDRHERRMADINQRRNELAKKLDEMNSLGPKNGIAEYVPPDIAGGDKESPDPRREIVGGDRGGDECFARPARKYDSCGATLDKEYNRWQAEVAQHDRDVKAETARHNRRTRALDDGRSRADLVKQEVDCHAERARQLEEEQDALQERHLKCFNLLTIENRRRP